MTKTLASVLLAVVALSAGVADAHAQTLTQPHIANRPGATLLLPYFEVDLDDANGVNTLFSVNNASATAMLANVTVWSDMGVPVFGFNVYLTGYDAQRFDMREILNGTVPRTASAGQDPGNQISNQGLISQDINFASCTGILPPPVVPDVLKSHMRSALTGNASTVSGGLCLGRNLGTPSVARGYVTVNTVNACTLIFPSDSSYHVYLTNQNTLFGEYALVDPSSQLAAGDALVHIVASPTDPETSIPGRYTFMGRHTGFVANDYREPLSTTFATRYVSAKTYKGDENRALLEQILPPATELIVWRDTKASANPFSCAGTPSWYPLNQAQIAAFDEAEEVEDVNAIAFPAATQRVTVGSSALPVTKSSGWLHLNLNTTVTGQVPGLSDPAVAQAWVSVLHRVYQGPTGGRYDIGFRAIRLDSARTPMPTTATLPIP